MKFIKFYNEGAESAIVSKLAERFKLDVPIMKLIYSKGYRTEQDVATFLSPEKQPFKDPFLLNGMSECVEKIKQAVNNKKRILIFGDYDVDGISATAVLIKTLKKMGSNASSYLPNRYIDGYGLTNEVLEKIKQKFNPELIITVDCGISCKNEVEYCKQLGIDIIVTDHHEIPEEIPDTIVVNPKLKNQAYEFDGLCGTGVAFKVAQALIGTEQSEDLLPIVAIATIADIVPLTHENRTMVKKGMALMSRHLPVGLKQMLKLNKINLSTVSASDIAFKIAPKLNASGRMGDAEDSLNLILETNPIKIKELLNTINEHNKKRQELCNKVFDDCIDMIKNMNMSEYPAIILKSENWDHGILGIVCSRLVDEYNRPVFLFSKVNDELKGSVRSINDINVHYILSNIQDILEVFGGHKIAAGLTLKDSNYNEFCSRVYGHIHANISNQAFIPIDYYDCEITLKELTPKFVSDLELLEPCGCENAKPKFLIKTQSAQIVPLKNSPTHAQIIIGKKLNLIFFRYLQEQAKLNFGKEYSFIFEIQSQTKSVYKGIVKGFTTGYGLKNSATTYFDSFKLSQLQYLKENRSAKYKMYEQNEILDFIVGCSNSSFGICFATFSTFAFLNFVEKYELSSLYEFNILNSKSTGFNSIYLCPSDISFAKSYKKIVFLDSVFDETYLAEINKISDAEIYIPKENNYDNKIFETVNLDKNFIRNIYLYLTKLENRNFPSILSIYTTIIKENRLKISFNNFLFYYFIMCELKIINPYFKEDFYSFKINKLIKTDLNKSSIYNMAKLIKKIN